jgi:serralysin
MATLTVTATQDFGGLSLVNINSVVFATSGEAVARFDSNQFGTQSFLGFQVPLISNTVRLTGDANRNIMMVDLLSPSFSAAGWTFTNWSSQDVVVLSGTAGSDTITGSAQHDAIQGQGGIDHLFGGDGDDAFLYHATARGSVDGGNGLDEIDLAVGGNTYQLGSLSITSVELLSFGTPDVTAHIDGDQIGFGAIRQVRTVATGNSLFVEGDHVDLSTVSFVGSQSLQVTIDGVQSAFNVLSGSLQSEIIHGGALSDTLHGNGGDDTLSGGGGADILHGDFGNDTASYAASASGVQVNLATGTGLGGDAQGDTLTSIENVTGSAFGDLLTGNAAANKLVGGGGNDEFTGLNGGDLLDGGAGVNTARYDFSPGAVQINLVTGTGTGADAQGDALINVQNLVGSTFGDTLTGDGNANTIFGGGGNDVLAGGGGADLFVFTTAPDTVTNVDAITDFQVGIDTIQLDHNVFAGLTVGDLAAAPFTVGSAAADAADRIVYDPTTGALFFDADGSGAGAQVEFATVLPGVALTHNDFAVI